MFGKPLKRGSAERATNFVRLDTLIGMVLSNLIGIFTIVTAAISLHTDGVADVQSSACAIDALKPVAGAVAELTFD